MKRKPWVSLCLAALMLLSLCGCGEQVSEQAEVMQGGVFAYRDGFIYFADNFHIYEYDTQTGKTVMLKAIGDLSTSLFALEDKLLYVESGASESARLNYVTRDGKNSGNLLQQKNASFGFYDGKTWYGMDSIWIEEEECFHGRFWSRDTTTDEETLLLEVGQILDSDVDENYIYVAAVDDVPDPELDALLEALENKKKEEASSTDTVTGQGKADEVLSEEEEDRRWKEQREKERQERERIDYEKSMNDDYYLLRSPRDKISFERVAFSLKPIQVLADGEDLYISQMGTWQVYHYAGGVETALPMTSVRYQLIDGHLLYMEEAPGKVKPRGNALKLYDLKTGEEKLFAESAFYFAVLAERYIAYGVNLDGSNFRWYVYDWQTGVTTEMVKPV